MFRASLAACLLAASAASAEEGCSRDVDCKGDRICVQRECVAPPAPPPVSVMPSEPVAPVQRSSPAQASAPARTVQHHRGFYFRPDLGVGYLNSSASQGGTDRSLYGAAASFGVAIGGSLAPNHVLAFHIWDVGVTDPTVSANGSSGSSSNTHVDVVCLGPEYTWYSPTNFYLSFSPGVSRLHLESNGVSADTNLGFGLRTALGKEWWVSDNWGLGAAAMVSFSANPDQGSNAPTWTTWGLTLAFSATYN